MSTDRAGTTDGFARRLLLVASIAASAGLSAALAGWAAQRVAGNRMAPWIIGRAAGVTAYLLLVVLVLLGLLLSHPWRTRITRPSSTTRIRLHVVLAVFTLAFIVLHVAVLATDSYAGIGWRGWLVPMGAQYRPVATTLGLVGLWSGLLAGITAGWSGHLPLRLWWPIHKLSSVSLLLIWLHGVFGGSDSTPLTPLYLITAGLVLIAAVGRYTARTPRDQLIELTESAR
jgi:hypothetical protein